MNEYFRLVISGRSYGSEECIVTCQGGKYRAERNVMLWDNLRKHGGVLEDADLEDWYTRLKRFRFEDWEDEYRNKDVVVLDGIQWEIEYRADGVEKHITGDNAYPNRWGGIKQLIKELDEMIENNDRYPVM